MKAVLCRCNNCESIMLDENPPINASLSETNNYQTKIHRMSLFDDEGGRFWGCWLCETDEYLIDLKIMT